MMSRSGYEHGNEALHAASRNKVLINMRLCMHLREIFEAK